MRAHFAHLILFQVSILALVFGLGFGLMISLSDSRSFLMTRLSFDHSFCGLVLLIFPLKFFLNFIYIASVTSYLYQLNFLSIF